jgi:hypothetical protein
LPAIVLLFHEEKQLIETPQWRTVALNVMGKRLSKPNEGYTAMMSDFVTHGSLKRYSWHV